MLISSGVLTGWMPRDGGKVEGGYRITTETLQAAVPGDSDGVAIQ